MKTTPEIFRVLILVVTIAVLFTLFSCGTVDKTIENTKKEDHAITNTVENSKSKGTLFSTTTNQTDEYRLNYIPIDPTKAMKVKNLDGETQTTNARQVFEKIKSKTKTDSEATNENETTKDTTKEETSVLDQSIRDIFKMGIPWYFWVILFVFAIVGIVVFTFLFKIMKGFSTVSKILPTLQNINQ